MIETEKLTTIITGIVLIVAGIMILEYPEFVYYWIAGAFMLTGITFIIRAIKKSE